MYNKIILAGNLARDIEIRYTQGGSAIGKTAIATNRKYKSQTGEQKEEVMFIDLTFFGRTAEIANQYLRKGSKVLVDGRLTLDQWTAQDGSKRSKHSITVENLQMLGDGNGAGHNGGGEDYNNYDQSQAQGGQPGYTGQPQAGTHQQHAGQPQGQQQNHTIQEIDDEIPF